MQHGSRKGFSGGSHNAQARKLLEFTFGDWSEAEGASVKVGVKVDARESNRALWQLNIICSFSFPAMKTYILIDAFLNS